MKCRPNKEHSQVVYLSRYKKLCWALMAVTVPALEVALFIYISRYIGLWTTAGLVLLSTAIGLYFWLRWWKGIIDRQVQYREAYGEKLQNMPPDLFFLSTSECINSLIAFFCLLAPGFISDLYGLLLATSWLHKTQAQRLADQYRKQAAAKGKSVREILSERLNS